MLNALHAMAGVPTGHTRAAAHPGHPAATEGTRLGSFERNGYRFLVKMFILGVKAWVSDNRYRLNEAQWAGRRDDAGMSEPCLRKKGHMLCLGALTAARHDKHVDVEELRFGGFRALRNDALDHEKSRAVGHGAPAGREDAHCVRVVPIIDHALQEVEVPPLVARSQRNRRSRP